MLALLQEILSTGFVASLGSKQPVQLQRIARILKIWRYCSLKKYCSYKKVKNKGAEQTFNTCGNLPQTVKYMLISHK